MIVSSRHAKAFRDILFLLTCLVFLLAPLLIGVPRLHAEANKVVAEIDGKKLTQKDFKAYLELFQGNPAYHPATMKDKKRLLNNLVNRTLLLEAARKEGYFKKKELKKHPNLGKTEEETFVLRAYLMDHVSKKVSITPKEIEAYQKAHPGMKAKEAKEALTTLRQKALFRDLMKRLRAGHTIRIYPEAIK
ncbi:MAG: hypothetical protein DSY91_02970 [Deltaproteobacteria bacterium]|nr:MAG: hypothetical protein DSY91_02970 [Deltaproteobacteria bacterium]